MDDETQKLIESLHLEIDSLRQHNKDVSALIANRGLENQAQPISLLFTYDENREFSFRATREDLEDPAIKMALTHGCNLLDLTVSYQKAKYERKYVNETH